MMNNAIYIENQTQASFAISSTAAQSSALERGYYDVWSTIDCYLRVDETATGVTTANGYMLFSGNTITLFVDDQRKIGAITAAGTGTLSLHKVG
jgi:hypothetical protein